ncbi:unnamed protein product [Bursaphelenchus xylophilus]|uniref:(pine wood nematode) hypothetical protein n=1 Tax=Bursaphelenchus xylophilus TaxID=6326 RepID=A0A1I7SLV1_BURXY|nr:unnamed protein product [Bursaphelenchus xylophilus]CAG9129858.1 unnamed protein product [Bursaphelenchus xylophilus]
MGKNTWGWVQLLLITCNLTSAMAHEDNLPVNRLRESAQLLLDFHKWWTKAAEELKNTVNETSFKIDNLVRDTSELIKSELKSLKVDDIDNSTDVSDFLKEFSNGLELGS